MPHSSASYVTVSTYALAMRTGLWCEACLLPSRCESDFVLLLDGKPDHLFTYSLLHRLWDGD